MDGNWLRMNRCKVFWGIFALFLCGISDVSAQTFRTMDATEGTSASHRGSSKSSPGRSGTGKNTWGRDTTDNSGFEVPIGVTQWTVDENLGAIIPAENNDTVVHMFQWYNETSGYNGEYSLLGNLGAPRLSRIYLHREKTNPHLFLQPFDFFIGGLHDFRFSNTFSPLTNLAYHKVGNKTNGQERVRAYFASNINKVAGIGMKFDYLYGRGYYNNQANSQFGGTLFGYYLGDRYNLHTYFNLNHFKMAENGGIEDDAYITNPQSFPRSYGSKDIPTLLSETWNRNENQDAFLTHRYNLGFHRDIEVADSLKPKMPSDKEFLQQIPDSIRQILLADTVRQAFVLDSMRTVWSASQSVPQEFVPVSSIIHTLKINNLRHTYYSYATPANYYTNLFYGDLTSVKDRTKALSVKNTLGISLREGFNKWAQMGVAAFISHELLRYSLPILDPNGLLGRKRYDEHDIAVGGQITRTQGKYIHYDIEGQLSILGDNIGDFSADGTLTSDIPLSRRDTLAVEIHGMVDGLSPDFYLRHYHSQFLWWDKPNWANEFHGRIEGSLHLPRIGTHLYVGFENIKNFTYLAMENTVLSTSSGNALPGDFSHNVVVRQAGSNIQVFSARLVQKLKFGPLHWDNDITYQTSSNGDVLPLPKLNIYSNLYLHFRIAKVLNVELGGDLRYFTKYYAPDYSPAIQQFAIQDANHPRIKIGNYPLVSVYANLHIKHCRIYVLMQHVNQGSGHRFWAPHYPMDPRTFHFGVSWNFFN